MEDFRLQELEAKVTQLETLELKVEVGVEKSKTRRKDRRPSQANERTTSEFNSFSIRHSSQ